MCVRVLTCRRVPCVYTHSDKWQVNTNSCVTVEKECIESHNKNKTATATSKIIKATRVIIIIFSALVELIRSFSECSSIIRYTIERIESTHFQRNKKVFIYKYDFDPLRGFGAYASPSRTRATWSLSLNGSVCARISNIENWLNTRNQFRSENRLFHHSFDLTLKLYTISWIQIGN